MNYVIGDFLIRLKNSYMAHKREVVLPYSKAALNVGQVLVKEGYLESVKSANDGNKTINATLKYVDRRPAISDIKIVSKPSVRIYVAAKELKVKGYEFGMYVLSTSKGIMSDKEALDKGLGGELICKVS